METCAWKEEYIICGESTNTWDTDCNNMFTITEGTPSENGFKFCPYCGKRLVENKETKMEDWEGLDSNCCGAPIIHMDLCSECKEHCEPMPETEEDRREQRGEWMMECERNGD